MHSLRPLFATATCNTLEISVPRPNQDIGSCISPMGTRVLDVRQFVCGRQCRQHCMAIQTWKAASPHRHCAAAAAAAAAVELIQPEVVQPSSGAVANSPEARSAEHLAAAVTTQLTRLVLQPGTRLHRQHCRLLENSKRRKSAVPSTGAQQSAAHSNRAGCGTTL